RRRCNGQHREVSHELALRDVVLEFGHGPRGLRIARWRVSAGAHVAVCGPSGSGKTTLLDALAGLRRPDEGGIAWGKVDLANLPQSALDCWRRERVGLVFQQFDLFPGLSAIENVLLPLRFDAWSVAPEARAYAANLLARARIDARSVVA